MNKFTCPNGHWWKQKGGATAKCICGEKGKTNDSTSTATR